MSKELEKRIKVYTLAEELSIKADELDEFKVENDDNGYSWNWEEFAAILEMVKIIKEKLAARKIDVDLSLNDHYENGYYRWPADQLGVRIQLLGGNLNTQILVEPNHLEVFDFDNIDETDYCDNYDAINTIVDNAIALYNYVREAEEE